MVTINTKPLLPLRDIVVFPSMVVPLFVGREKSIKALQEVMKTDKSIVLVSQKNSEIDEPENKDIYGYGCLSKVLQLLKFGLIPEFIGRLPMIATLEDLDEKSLIKILQEPKNSLTKQYQKLFEFENVELEFQDDALNEIAKKAISKKTGARGLRSILESILLKTMFELPELENVIKVTVDKSSVLGNTDPVITYGKKQSTSAA